MKIRTRLNFTFIGVFVVLMVVVGFVMQVVSSNILKEQINLRLETAVQSRSKNIDMFLEDQKDKIKIAATGAENSEVVEVSR